VSAFDLSVEILQESDSGTEGVVGRELEEVELVGDLDGSREVGDEDEARLERCDEQRVASLVLEGELDSKLAYAAFDLLTTEVDGADATVD
jgi:hypothetical protein